MITITTLSMSVLNYQLYPFSVIDSSKNIAVQTCKRYSVARNKCNNKRYPAYSQGENNIILVNFYIGISLCRIYY